MHGVSTQFGWNFHQEVMSLRTRTQLLNHYHFITSQYFRAHRFIVLVLRVHTTLFRVSHAAWKPAPTITSIALYFQATIIPCGYFCIYCSSLRFDYPAAFKSFKIVRKAAFGHEHTIQACLLSNKYAESNLSGNVINS